jgi:flagellar basal body-associated protein FliL
MKKILIIVFVLALAAAAFAQSADWFKGTVDEAVAKAKASGKLVLVDFYSYT